MLTRREIDSDHIEWISITPGLHLKSVTSDPTLDLHEEFEGTGTWWAVWLVDQHGVRHAGHKALHRC